MFFLGLVLKGAEEVDYDVGVVINIKINVKVGGE